jgi:hypothetical protein
MTSTYLDCLRESRLNHSERGSRTIFQEFEVGDDSDSLSGVSTRVVLVPRVTMTDWPTMLSDCEPPLSFIVTVILTHGRDITIDFSLADLVDGFFENIAGLHRRDEGENAEANRSPEMTSTVVVTSAGYTKSGLSERRW